MSSGEPMSMIVATQEENRILEAGAPLRVLVLTNMYPSPPRRPALGIFVKEQVESLREAGLEVDVLFVDGPANRLNYLWGFFRLWRRLRAKKYDLIHAHYVFSALIALAQPSLPVVATFHSGEVLGGSFERTLSHFVSKRVDLNVAVSREVLGKLKGRCCVIPCGVDTGRFFPVDRSEARARLGLSQDAKLVLFAAAMRPEKRFDLVKEAFEIVKGQREDAALACNLPVVSTDVGDVRELIGSVPGCYIAEPNADAIAAKLLDVLASGKRIDGRNGVSQLSLEAVARRLLDSYSEVIESRARSKKT